MYVLISLHRDIIVNAILGHTFQLDKQCKLGKISKNTFFAYEREIVVSNGLLDNLCKDAARQITDAQNVFREIALCKKPIVEYFY